MSNRESDSLLDLPLAGVRVVDVTIGWASAIGAYLAELGADTMRVGRHEDVEGRGGIAALLHDRLKRVADEPLDVLIGTADILIVSPGIVPDVQALAAAHPALVILHASDFGMAGPLSGWQATGPVLHALSGELSRSGKPGREPLLPPGDLAYACAAGQALFVILVAYLEKLRTGRGDLLDFAALDGAMHALDPGFGIGGSATLGVPASQMPRGRPKASHQYPILPCADGRVRIAVLGARQWQGLFRWMGEPAEFADPSFNATATRFASPSLLPAIGAFFADKTRAELEEEGARRGVPITAMRTIAEAIDSEQMRVRRAFTSLPLRPGVSVPIPNGTLEIDGARTGEAPRPQTASSPRSFGNRAGERPLDGLRVLDLGVIVVGAESGRLLADQGADVIKVEAAAFPDGSRSVRNKQGMSVLVASGHRNKRSFGINLRDEQGKALFRKLAEKSDIIFSNFKAGTMESLGLGYAELAAINPRIIMVDSSAYGPTGPWNRRLGYGPLVRAAAGLTAQWRYDDDPESYSDAVTIYPDHVAARIGAAAALSLVVRRERTGHGGTVSISQAEVMLSHMAAQIAASAAGIETEGPAEGGPWGVFACAGDDEWCVVTARHDADRAALAQAIGVDDVTAGLEEALESWLAERRSIEAAAVLQTAGVPAGPMLHISELPDFDHYRERGVFRTEEHPYLREPLIAENAPVLSRHLPDPPTQPAPAPGQQTAEIAREQLALTQAEIDALVEAGILETPASFGQV